MPTASRRQFNRLAAFGAGTAALLSTGSVRAAADASRTAAAPWPEIPKRTLGRTGFEASRLIFGCGAALSRRKRDDLLDLAYDAGINVFDVGFRSYYGDAEANLAGFLKRRRDNVFLISKAYVPTDIDWDETISLSEAREAAKGWSAAIDGSLAEMQVEHIDAYYQMAANNTSVIRSEELYRAFEDAKAAGKVSHLGLSTHQNAQAVLAAAAETGWFDLAMIAVTPAGWYDFKRKEVLPDSPPMTALADDLANARKAGIGLVGMKAGRYLAGGFFSKGDPDLFAEHYSRELLTARLSDFQKSYAYVLEHGLDVVNADMQAVAHLKENAIAASVSGRYADTA